MPLFFFHLRTPSGLERDEDGVEYPDLDAAYLEACKAIPGLSAELLSDRRDAMACAFEIADVADTILMRVPFDEGVRRPRRWPSTVSAVVANLEQTQRLVTEVREQHAEAQRQIAGLRDLLAETGRRDS